MEVEPITFECLEPLTQLILELWPDSSHEEEYEHCRKILQSEKDTAFLAGNPDVHHVGFVIVSLRTDYVEGTRSSPVGYLEGIYVKPEYRQSGVGRRLVAAAEHWCRSKGCVEMASDTGWSNHRSQKFHRKLGFEEVNRVVCFRKDITV